MTRALTLCLLLLSSLAHAGSITFHRDKPADLNAKGQDHFKAGELIYAVAKLDKPLSQLDEGKGKGRLQDKPRLPFIESRLAETRRTARWRRPE